MDKEFHIEIVYGDNEQQVIVQTRCLAGTTAASVLDQAKLDLTWRNYSIGSFSRFIDVDAPLLNPCRLELYRSLLIDPKQARLARANKNPLIRVKHRNIRGYDARLVLTETE